jgi:hypothetical protein
MSKGQRTDGPMGTQGNTKKLFKKFRIKKFKNKKLKY